MKRLLLLLFPLLFLSCRTTTSSPKETRWLVKQILTDTTLSMKKLISQKRDDTLILIATSVPPRQGPAALGQLLSYERDVIKDKGLRKLFDAFANAPAASRATEMYNSCSSSKFKGLLGKKHWEFIEYNSGNHNLYREYLIETHGYSPFAVWGKSTMELLPRAAFEAYFKNDEKTLCGALYSYVLSSHRTGTWHSASKLVEAIVTDSGVLFEDGDFISFKAENTTKIAKKLAELRKQSEDFYYLGDTLFPRDEPQFFKLKADTSGGKMPLYGWIATDDKASYRDFKSLLQLYEEAGIDSLTFPIEKAYRSQLMNIKKGNSGYSIGITAKSISFGDLEELQYTYDIENEFAADSSYLLCDSAGSVLSVPQAVDGPLFTETGEMVFAEVKGQLFRYRGGFHYDYDGYRVNRNVAQVDMKQALLVENALTALLDQHLEDFREGILLDVADDTPALLVAHLLWHCTKMGIPVALKA